MTVPLILSEVPDVTPYIQYVATSGQTVFPYPFPITQDSDLIVVVNGVTLSTDAGYTLSGQGDDTGGNVTFTAGATVGDIITLYRDIAIERISQISQNSGFSSTVFNAEYNNIYLILQQLEASIEQCLQIPNTNNPAPVTTLLPASYASKYLAFDSYGNPTPAALTSSGSLTGQIIASLLNLITTTAPTADKVQSAAELSASVTPTNYAFLPGDLRRYGADPTGISDSSSALSQALSCNSLVFDSFPGGGLYIFTAETVISKFPVTIRGQAKNNGDTSGLSGTRFKLMTAAGSGKAVLAGAYLDGLNVTDVGFLFESANAQFGIHVHTISATAGQLRSSTVKRCAFIGTGIGDTNVGIQIETGTGGSQYSAFNLFEGNYFDALSGGIKFTGNTTPNMLVGNTFLGYTGADSAAAGSGVEIDTGGVEVKLVANYFEGWTQGIYSNGAANIQQIGNDYQACTYGFNWVAPVSGIINNQSIGETGVAGTYSGESNLDSSQIQILGRLGSVTTGGPIQSTRGFQEGTGTGTNLNAQLLGYGASPSVVMGANGGGSIGSQTTTTWSVSYVGGHIYLDFIVSGTLTGASTSALELPIPGGLFPVVDAHAPCSVTNNGATAFGLAYVNTSNATLFIGLGASGSGDFTAGSVGAAGQIRIRTA